MIYGVFKISPLKITIHLDSINKEMLNLNIVQMDQPDINRTFYPEYRRNIFSSTSGILFKDKPCVRSQNK